MVSSSYLGAPRGWGPGEGHTYFSPEESGLSQREGCPEEWALELGLCRTCKSWPEGERRVRACILERRGWNIKWEG